MVIKAMYLVDPVVKKAIHAPNKDWEESVDYLFGGGPNEDPSKRSSGSFIFETNTHTRLRSRVCVKLD